MGTDITILAIVRSNREKSAGGKIRGRGFFLAHKEPSSMAKLPGASADRIAEYFIAYLFNQYGGSLHVRRVAAWLGFVVAGIQRAIGQQWHIQRKRQLWFEYGGYTFKLKYNHRLKPRGGVEIVEVLPGQGHPEGRVVAAMRDLNEVEQFYNDAPMRFRQFVRTPAKVKAAKLTA